MKFNIGILAVSLLLVSTTISSNSSGNIQSISKDQELMCHVPSVAKAQGYQVEMMDKRGVNILDQNPNPGQGGQPEDTPTHRKSPGDGCSSVNPNAPNKERDGIVLDTVGCTCVRKCINGQTTEDLSRDEKGIYVCKNACHRDRCKCPDPCKS